jgi:DNA-binding NtrC family response regulator
MSSQVIVFDYGEPQHRLLAWFLSDSGINNFRVTALPDVVELLDNPGSAVVVVNSRESTEEIARVAAEIKNRRAEVRVVVVHDGNHHPEELEVLADLCIHGVQDVDDLVKAITAALENEIPQEEPHEAAEEIINE